MICQTAKSNISPVYSMTDFFLCSPADLSGSPQLRRRLDTGGRQSGELDNRQSFPRSQAGLDNRQSFPSPRSQGSLLASLDKSILQIRYPAR